jgi:uncharacterized protein YfcZ (UPF0381/DUF406 family)
MISLAEQSIDHFTSMPMRLSSVEKQLDQAEKYFKEAAFVPFWDSIETAAKMLAQFDELIGDLKEKASRYTEITRLYENEDAQRDMTDQVTYAIMQRPSDDPVRVEIDRILKLTKLKLDTPPPYPTQHIAIEVLRICMLGNMYKGEDWDTPLPYPITPQHIAKLNDASKTTVTRMETLVQAAHRNFHFATIYEQRRTNQILIAGFTNLAEALNQMACKITASINDLAISIGAMTSMLNESLDTIHTDLGEALEMLDNIQRGKRPFP